MRGKQRRSEERVGEKSWEEVERRRKDREERQERRGVFEQSDLMTGKVTDSAVTEQHQRTQTLITSEHFISSSMLRTESIITKVIKHLCAEVTQREMKPTTPLSTRVLSIQKVEKATDNSRSDGALRHFMVRRKCTQSAILPPELKPQWRHIDNGKYRATTAWSYLLYLNYCIKVKAGSKHTVCFFFSLKLQIKSFTLQQITWKKTIRSVLTRS